MENSPLILGFGFKARRGKDTACKAIIDARGAQAETGFDIRRYGFADELKREVNAAADKAGSMFELIQTMRVTHNLPQWVQYEFAADMTDPLCPLGKQRTLLQWWGTEYRRNNDRFYWVKRMRERIMADKPQVALISDVRFMNELLWVKANKGYTIKLEREGFSDNLGSHVSEQELERVPFDFEIIVQDGDLEELQKDAVRVFDMIRESLEPQDIVVEVPYGEAPVVVA